MKKILLASRFIFKRKGFAFINIFGLALGITACLLITLYVKYHKSYDLQAPYPERTYRVTYQRWAEGGDRVEFASASPTIGPAMKERFPEVEKFARAFKQGGVFTYQDQVFEEEMAFYGESNLFEILGFEMIKGNPNSCLDLPNQIVLSQTIAYKYFGNENPLGKTMVWNGRHNLEVTGVYKDCPPNIHFKPTLFVSMATWEKRTPQLFQQGWYNSGFYTYVRLQEGTFQNKIDNRIEEFIENEFGETLREYNMWLSFRLQPITDIHLTSKYMHEIETNNDKTSIALLEIVAWFILIIAWVNFFNLSTISSLKRMKEIGIRKVNGATRKDLITQMLSESAIINLAALLLALTLLELSYPFFANIAGLPQDLTYINQPWFYFFIIVAFMIGTLSAGVYAVSGIRGNSLSATLRGMATKSKKGQFLKKTLVTIQFAIAIALITATISVYYQFQQLQSKDLGFNLHNMLVIKVPKVGNETLHGKYWVFHDMVKDLPFINGAAYSSVIPGKPNMFNRGGIYRYGEEVTNGKNMRLTEVDAQFTNVYDINLVAGEGFTGNPAEDANNVMLNLKGALWLGFKSAEDAVGEQVVLEGIPKKVVGVLVDFNQLSPKEEIEPQIFRYPQRFQGYFTLKIEENFSKESISSIEKIYSSVFPGNPFDFFFLDSYYNSQFKDDKRFGMVFALFSILSIVITVLGLLGLSAYTAQQRKREIGIRKVLGAKVTSIVQLLFYDYLILWALSSAVAIPIAWHFLNQWLNNYANKITPTWWIFTIPMLTVLLVAMVTILAQSLKAAYINPVESIKEE